jgi:hypothetical protein
MADKKFSDLVANPDTNLAVAAVGDYLLIYDISEPLDINKIKVISVADLFAGQLEMTKRQGGSATDFSLRGNTDYTLSVPPLIQFGSKEVPFTINEKTGSATVTFETAFAYRPIIFVTFSGTGQTTGTDATVAYAGQIETTYFTARIKNATTQLSAHAQTVHWIAIGQAA